MRKNMAPSKTQHHRIRFWINNQAYNIYKRDTTFWENRNPTSLKSNTYTDEAHFTVQVGPNKGFVRGLRRGNGGAFSPRKRPQNFRRKIIGFRNGILALKC